MRKLTTTSYAILGLFSLRPWSAYELAKQMRRSLRFYLPRAESALYEEPKNLVAHGLARAATERRGRRNVAIYSITAKGRRALEEWVQKPSAPPQFEAEALVRVLFAEHATKEHLLATLQGLRDHAEELRRLLIDQGREYPQSGGPFPQRLHLIALTGRFNFAYAALLDDWARWAEEEVKGWPDTAPLPTLPVAQETFRSLLGEELVAELEEARASVQ